MDWSSVLGDNKPYPHQVQTAAALLEGRPVLLRAPTGSGKTEAILAPFLHSLSHQAALPTRLLYSLPMRVLATSLCDRVNRWETGVQQAWCQHGDDPQSPLFERPVVFSTIDQTIGSFLTCPPTLPRKLGNMAAGAVAGAMLAFDEVQLLDPRRALQAMIVLLDAQKHLHYPFVIASATFPDVLVSTLQERFGCEAAVEVEEETISRRAARRVNLELLAAPGLPVSDVLEAAAGEGNVAVICNTVARAQEAYLALRPALGDRVLLLHSQFLAARRRVLERQVLQACGRNADAYARTGTVVVSTQVIEAGLDASFDTMFSECAPVDSLIQRAGRVARGGGQGRLVLYRPEAQRYWAPYCEKLVGDSVAALHGVRDLDWQTEQRLVNEVIGPYLQPLLGLGRQAMVRELMAESVWQGSRHLAQQAVRESASCNLSIHASPGSLAADVRGLASVAVHVGSLRGWWGAGRLQHLARVAVEWNESEHPAAARLEPVTAAGQIVPDCYYVCHPDSARHCDALGLRVGEAGADFPLLARQQRPPLEGCRCQETWVQHAVATASALRRCYLGDAVWQRLADCWGLPLQALHQHLLVAAVLHDLGKLTEQWQGKAGRTRGASPLAHTDSKVRGLPAHATLGAWVLSQALDDRASPLRWSLRLAIQHHHSAGACKTPAEGYTLLDDWQALADEALRSAGLSPPAWLPVESAAHGARSCQPEAADLDKPRCYVTYVLACRALRGADWIATGGGDDETVLGYEDWFRNA